MISRPQGLWYEAFMRFGWSLATMIFVSTACAGGQHTPEPGRSSAAPGAASPEPSTDPNEGELAAPDAAAGDPTASDAGAEESGGPSPGADVASLLEELGVPGTANPREGVGLRLGVAEAGPERPWLLVVANDSEHPVKLSADPRLLRLKVQVPGKKRAVECTLPKASVPERPDPRTEVVLEPGEAVAHAFDPRLYCFPSAGTDALVPGSIVTPYFGWRPSTSRGKAKGKTPQPPYVAEVQVDAAASEAASPPAEQQAGASENAKSAPSSSSRATKATPEIDPDRVAKELTGNTFALRSTYADWPHRAAAPELGAEAPFTLRMVQGSDAEAERQATVQLTLKNISDKTQRLYFRRELVSFEVMGPDGLTSCDPGPDGRAPDRQAFSTLRPGGTITITSRLVELCPVGVFARPGLYLVHARLDALDAGERHELSAFTGSVLTPEPAAVRIRKGELPILQNLGMTRIRLED